MKSSILPLIILVVLLSALASAVATTFVAGRILSQREPESESVTPSASSQLASAVQELSSGQKQLSAELDELRTQVALVEDTASRSLALREERALSESNLSEAIAATASRPVGEEPAGVEARTVDEYVSSLFAPGMGENDRQAIWKQIREAGVLEDVIAAVEARVEADPGNPDRHYELGSTYLQKIFEVGNGPEAGVWATKADNSFDAALDIDPEHWNSRFNKAVSLSFWPPIFGKQTEAIQQFEVLVGQQANTGLNEPKYAQTHLLLGNMYQQSGKLEQAIASWEAGLAAFPGSEELLAQLELHKAK